MTAVKLARHAETVGRGKPPYDSKSVGEEFAVHLGGVDGETVPNDTESEFTSRAMGCAALWLEFPSIHHLGGSVGTVQKTARMRARRRDR